MKRGFSRRDVMKLTAGALSADAVERLVEIVVDRLHAMNLA